MKSRAMNYLGFSMIILMLSSEPLQAILPGKIVMTKHTKLTNTQKLQLYRDYGFHGRYEREAIFVLDPNTTHQYLLTPKTPYEEIMPCVSSDGKKVAFSRYLPVANNQKDIWCLVTRSTGDSDESIQYFDFDFIPTQWVNDNYIVGNIGHTICVVNPNNTKLLEQYTESKIVPACASIDRNTGSLYFEDVSNAKANGTHVLEINVRNIGDNTTKRILVGYDPEINPDGSEILYNYYSSIWLYNTKTFSKRLVAKFGQSAHFSPDGKYIAYLIRTPYGKAVIILTYDLKPVKKIAVGDATNIDW